MISPEQLRMARAGLGISVRDLSRMSGVSANTINRYENGADALSSTLLRLRRTLEEAGIEFVDEDGGGPGVRLKRRSPPSD